MLEPARAEAEEWARAAHKREGVAQDVERQTRNYEAPVRIESDSLRGGSELRINRYISERGEATAHCAEARITMDRLLRAEIASEEQVARLRTELQSRGCPTAGFGAPDEERLLRSQKEIRQLEQEETEPPNH